MQRKLHGRARSPESARDEHLLDRKTLQNILAEGREQTADKRLRNTCEWLTTYAITPIYALTPHPESDEITGYAGTSRAPMVAYFGSDAPLFKPGGAPGNPAEVPRRNEPARIHKATRETVGEGGGGGVTLFALTAEERKVADIHEILRHETQHVADRHLPRQGQEPAPQTDSRLTRLRPATKRVLEAAQLSGFSVYQTEFNAYSYEGTAASESEPISRSSLYLDVSPMPLQPSEVRGRKVDADLLLSLAEALDTVSHEEHREALEELTRSQPVFKQRFVPAAQARLILQLCRGYPPFSFAWFLDDFLGEPRAFQERVLDQPRPASINPMNSPRQHQLYVALQQLSPSNDAASLEFTGGTRKIQRGRAGGNGFRLVEVPGVLPLLKALEPAEREAAFRNPTFIRFVQQAQLHDSVKRSVFKTLRKRKVELIDSDTSSNLP